MAASSGSNVLRAKSLHRSGRLQRAIRGLPRRGAANAEAPEKSAWPRVG